MKLLISLAGYMSPTGLPFHVKSKDVFSVEQPSMEVAASSWAVPEAYAAYNRVRAEYSRHYATLDDSAKRALNSYSSSDGFHYNDHLRTNGGKVDPNFQYAYMHEGLMRACSARLSHQVRVWRGDDSFLSRVGVGSSLTLKHPLSTTFDVVTALGFSVKSAKVKNLIDIQVSKGAKYGLPQNSYEGELLLPIGTRLTVKSRESTESGGVTYNITSVIVHPARV